MKILLLLTFWLFTCPLRAQYIKIDNGAVLSSFYNEDKLPFLFSDCINTYSFLVGADYFIKKHFSMSSQIGLISIGGKDTSSFEIGGPMVTTIERASYIHFNTVGRASIKLNPRVSFFVGVGPYVNFMTGNETFNSPFFIGLNYENLHWGGRAETGVIFDIDRLRIGLVGAFMNSFSPPVQSEVLSLNNRVYSVALTTGYRIQ
ncbi:MAG: hypothetical protein HC880_02985 [Bacteroidia bacterium]|nr:hypothetical protein [Bacteroidia bacterium]